MAERRSRIRFLIVLKAAYAVLKRPAIAWLRWTGQSIRSLSTVPQGISWSAVRSTPWLLMFTVVPTPGAPADPTRRGKSCAVWSRPDRGAIQHA
jgi:hypothetical protein